MGTKKITTFQVPRLADNHLKSSHFNTPRLGILDAIISGVNKRLLQAAYQECFAEEASKKNFALGYVDIMELKSSF